MMKNKFRYAPMFIAAAIVSITAGCSNLPQKVVSTPVPPTNTPVSEVQVVEDVEEAEQEPMPTEIAFTPTPVPTEIPTPKAYFRGSSWYTLNFVSKDNLTFNEKVVTTGDTAAAEQMVLDFWHSYNENYQTMEAQKIINLNSQQGQFNERTGLNIIDTKDELEDIGYNLIVNENSTKKEMLDALEKYGPLLVLVTEKWVPAGADHIAVLTGYDASKDLVRLLDPAQSGGIIEFYFENFDSIWGMDYSKDPQKPIRRTFYAIVPFAEMH